MVQQYPHGYDDSVIVELSFLLCVRLQDFFNLEYVKACSSPLNVITTNINESQPSLFHHLAERAWA